MPSSYRVGPVRFLMLAIALLGPAAVSRAATPVDAAKAAAALAFDPYNTKSATSASTGTSKSLVLVAGVAAPRTASAPVSNLNPNQVQFAINDVTVPLPPTGGTTATFTVSLSEPCNTALTVNYATSNGTAKAGIDYVATSGTLSFPVGVQSKTVTVTINNAGPTKAIDFKVTLSGASGGSSIARPTGVGTIVPSTVAGPPSLSIYGATTNEGTRNHVVYVKVTLSAPAKQAVTFTFNTIAGTQSPFAEANGVDYNGYGLTKFTLPPGQTSVSIPVTITGGSKKTRTSPTPPKGSTIYFGVQIYRVDSGNATVKTEEGTVSILYDK
jgi:hypothetical protein